MKKFLYLLPLFFCLTTFAQKNEVFTSTKGKNDLIQNKIDGNFAFILPDNITEEEVIRNSSFYKIYFSVTFDTKTHEAVLKMKSNDAKSRHIISRFLTSFGVTNIETDGSFYTIEGFYDHFLK